MRIPQQPPDPWAVVVDNPAAWGDALASPGLQEFVRRCEHHYYHWDQMRFRAPANVDPRLAWALVKIGRLQRYRSTSLTGDDSQPITYNVPDPVQHELMLIDQQLAGRLLSDDDTPLSEGEQERFIVNALREEAIASSMLEGAATTRREAKLMLKKHRKPRTHGEQMVLNNYRAIEFIRENRHVDLTAQFLLELQAILTRDTLKNHDEVGRFRRDGDDISVVDQRDGEMIHTPPPAAELHDRVQRLCDFANGHVKLGFIHPVIRASIVHFQVGFDHPFCDGNGRTARALFYWLMLRRGYWLFEYLPISRLIYRSPAKYVRAFLYAETDNFDVTYFLLYSARIIARARHDLRAYIRRKQEQVQRARQLLASDDHLNHRQREVLLHMTRNPHRSITIAEHQGTFAIAYGTARRDLLDLAERGYLDQVRVGNRFEFRPGPRLQRRAAARDVDADTR